ncbi:hypothetical protein ESCO_001376 [Escovopsis weberi]|uniref:Protein transport protein use1 n=1 Tax=Escovopsis weberi TaxID=150374 RepID=A0A0M9VUF5_ESCWE|nr:hypothetical protein ESCO_001376 [Escovopsis weberi]
MATLAQDSLAHDGAHGSPDITPRELAILLSRLKQSILHPTQEDERRLRTSQYERIRVESNLRFARSALHHLEQPSSGRLTGKRGAEPPVDLHAQREVLELLFDRLEDYNKLAADYDDDEGSSEEDLLGNIMPTPSESQDSRRSERPRARARAHPHNNDDNDDGGGDDDDDDDIINDVFANHRPDAGVYNHHRRITRDADIERSPTARAALFASRRPAAATTATTAATAEAILDQQRGEQEAILDSIRRMAGALKQSSQSFSASLESDRGRLDAAGASMEKSGLSMEAAQGRMGSLRRMTEGEGWWGRMMLYAWVYGLMLVLLIVVFVLPKLRL